MNFHKIYGVLLLLIFGWPLIGNLAAKLSGNELSKCCSSGTRQYRRSSSCSNLHSLVSGMACIRTASICCLRALLDQSCEYGTTMALEEDYCPTNINQIGGGFRKECCDCCLLAKDIIRQNDECIPPSGLSLPCVKSFNECCKQIPRIHDSHYTTKLVNIMKPSGKCDTAECDHFCEEKDENVQCSCHKGYELGSDGHSCLDVDECLLLADDCLESQRCLNTPGSYKCIRILSCGTGYALDSDTEQCIDVDECNLGSHDCGPMYQCRNTQGSYRCDIKKCSDGMLMNPLNGECVLIDCSVGFKPVGGRCEDVDECADGSRCGQYEECVNTPGSFRCQEIGNLCGFGYRIDKETGFCVDIDECAEKKHTCDSGSCINLPGSFKCRCKAGFQFIETTKRCQDIDECKKFAGHVCSLHAVCENVIGSFKCHCNEGFRLARDGRNCIDIDECAEGTMQCAQSCINIPGSYQCICERGYQLAADGLTCEDIDECSLWAGSGDDLCMGGCVNTLGSYTCDCPPGYEIQADGRTCKDIDECTQRRCPNVNDICVNVLGSFKCHRIQCPKNYIHDKNYKNRCNRLRRSCERKSEDDCKNIPVRISWEFTTIPKLEPISKHRTSITLFTIKGPTNPLINVQFELTLKSAISEKTSTIPALRSNFLLQKGDLKNSAVIALRDSLDGSQEIHLELVLRLSVNETFQSKYVANLVIYVASQKRQRIMLS